MHAIHEYSTLLKAVLRQATQMVHSLPAGLHLAAGHDILNFLRSYGCLGYPSGRIGDFHIDQWLTRDGSPADRYDAVTIVPCFSDDLPPVTPSLGMDVIIPGACYFTDQVILLCNVDHWSVPELALTLLHEERHARHRIGPKIAGLPPLDQDETHEANTWLFTLNVLNVWGGKTWFAAVEQEVAWLKQQPLDPDHAGQLKYASSQHYWPELDQLFGVSQYSHVREVRQVLVALTANTVYWSKRASLPPEQVCHSLVTHFYK